MEPASSAAVASRIDAIDMLRGLMIVLMVLDHVRDFFGASGLHEPTDPDASWPLLYATRWITHLCAPTFVLLAGASIFLQGRRKTPGELSSFLVKRGLWLILLEGTVISFGFNFGEPFLFLQVIWAIGVGMLCMSVLSRLHPRMVLAVAILLITCSPLAGAATKGAVGAAGVLRTLLLSPGILPGVPSLAMYPALPWLGIMALGFWLGPVFERPTAIRRRMLAVGGLAMLTTFVVLRLANHYGDPAPWAVRSETARTVMSFLDVSKYPPSPDYVLATLGIASFAFLALERLRGTLARSLLAFGRTPLFTYVLHIYVAHGAMLAVAIIIGTPAVALNFIGRQTSDAGPDGWGFPLSVVYLVWIAVLLVMVPLSRWYGTIKRGSSRWWLSYL